MRISQLSFRSIPIPFRHSFRHAAAERSVAENVIVIAGDADGRIGVGEGCPRPYVTAETVDGAIGRLRDWRDEIISTVDSLAALERWMDGRRASIDRNPSAFCALELALLDLFARQAGKSIEGLLGMQTTTGSVAATAVYSAGHWAKFVGQAIRFAANGMTDAKLKLSGNTVQDKRRVALLAAFGKVRFDANNLWADRHAAIASLTKLAPYGWAVEEPLRARDWEGMSTVAQQTGLSVIVDESFTHIDDLPRLLGKPDWILNVRVSKLGGLLRTFATIDAAERHGLNIIVGSQVGETSILARAGLIAAAKAGSRLLGYEGAYGTHLLKWDVVTPSLTFGRGGRISLTHPGLDSVGAGLRPDFARLAY